MSVVPDTSECRGPVGWRTRIRSLPTWAPLALAILVACLPVLSAATVAVRAGWAPMIDESAIQILALDVGTDRTPLVGLPTTLVRATEVQEPGNHPGPLQFWLLAPFVRLVTAGPGGIASLAIAQALINLSLITASVSVLWQARRRNVDALLGGSFIALGLWIAGQDVAFSPWNPNAAFVALLTACLAAAACHLGRRPGALTVLALTASVAAQPHLLYAVAALAVGIGGAWSVIRGAAQNRRLVQLLPALVVLAVVWSGPVVDVAVNNGGNPALLAQPSERELPSVGAPGAFTKLATNLLPWRAALWRAPSVDRLGAPLTPVDAAATTLVLAALTAASVRGPTSWFGRVCLVGLGLLTAMTALSPASPGVLLSLHQQRVWIPFAIASWAVMLTWLATLRSVRVTRATSQVQLQTPLLAVALVVLLAAGVAPVVRGSSSVIMSPYCDDGIRTLARALPELDGRKVVLDSTGVPVWTLNFHSQVVLGLYAELVRRGADAQLAVGGGWQWIPGELGDRLIREGEDWPDKPQVVTVVGQDQPAPPTGTPLAIVTGENCTVAGDRLEVRLYG